MEVEGKRANHLPHILHGVFPALSAVLFISIGYIDPGKWAACIDSGARFGGDLAMFLFMFNLVAILCQYLSAHIGLICGKNLAQICNDEYGKFDRIFLGVQAELSIIMSDLAMILGIANGLHMMFRVDLFSAVLLTALDAILYPLFSTLLESSKANAIVIRIAGLTFLCYVLGLLIAQPEISISPISLPSKLMGESVYALMSLLGASMMPHNFYLHSSIVQRFQGSLGSARAPETYDNTFGIFAIFSSIFLVNYVLMNSASNMFYSSGLVLPTFQEAMSLMEQPLWSPIGPLAFLLLISSSHISGLSWEIGGEGGRTIFYDFFGIDLPGWLHCVTVRIFAIVPALYCLWYSGAEGMYQMLISTQVMVALLLPASVVALYQIASSKALMGANKISAVMEFFMMMSFMAVIGLQLIFLGEMVFGDSAWVGYLRWNMSTTSISSPHFILIVSGFASLCFTCRLFATPLRSADERSDAQQPWKWGRSQAVSDSLTESRENDMVGCRYYEEQYHERPGIIPSSEKGLETHSDAPAPIYDSDLPDSIMETDQEPYLTPIGEISTVKESSVSSAGYLELAVPVPEVILERSDVQRLASNESKIETADLVEKILRVEGEPETGKDGEEPWKPEEASTEAPRVAPSVAPEGLRSLTGKLDEGGGGAGSLSRLSGPGRAARRQLVAILEEFWGQLYDFHGQLTQEAKAKELGLLLGADPNSNSQTSLAKTDSVGKDIGSSHFLSVGGGGSDTLMNSICSTYGVQKGSSSPSLWPDKMQPLDAYVQRTGGDGFDISERRYSSLHLQPSSEDNIEKWYSNLRLQPCSMDNSERRYSSLHLQPSSEDNSERRYSSLRLQPSSDDNGDMRYSSLHLQPCSGNMNYQPATLHGYQFPSYLNRTAREPTDYMNSQRETPSPSLGVYNLRDPFAFGLSPKKTNGYSSVQTSAFRNLPASRNSMLQSDRSNYELFSPTLAENVANQNNPKKYHSLPDISGIFPPLQDVYLPNKYSQWGNPNTSTGFATSLGRTTPARSLYSNLASRVAPPGFSELSPRKTPRDVFPSRTSSGLDTGSLWYKQPFEKFGVANKTSSGVEGTGQKSLATKEPATSMVDLEVKLLQSLRHCILKLLKLEGSEWLFRQTDGVDEDLIDRVAARERFLYEAEFKDMKVTPNAYESQYSASSTKPGSAVKDDANNMVFSVPNCGEGCVWKAELVVSFGVWCIHRILELSLMESRPELWGQYTYVLNRLQGVIDIAFFKQRSPTLPCFCLQIAAAYQQRLNPASNGALPPTARPPKGKFTTAPMLLEIIKGIEIGICSRKGRKGTTAGDVAFPKGKENLASVLKRYKRRLSNKPVGAHDGAGTGPGPRMLLGPAQYAL